jgi:hypothetical protein
MKIVGYRTVNIVNGNYYYGVRTLRKENDPYLGSGLRLKAAVKKYGKECFIREDLATFVTFEEALEWERVTITEEVLKDPKCYNLKPGGAGGSLPWSEKKKKEAVSKGSYKKTDETKEKLSQTAKKRFENNPGTFKGKHHTDETKALWSEQRKGKPGKNKGKKLNLSEERLQELRKPKTEDVKEKIRKKLRKLSEEQVKFLRTEFVDGYGKRAEIARKWGVSVQIIANTIGTKRKNGKQI